MSGKMVVAMSCDAGERYVKHAPDGELVSDFAKRSRR